MEESFEETIKNNWAMVLGGLLVKLEGLKRDILKWAGLIKRKRTGIKEDLTGELKELIEEEVYDDSIAKIIDTKIHLNLETDKEERFWEQRARVNCLKVGDRNTIFFHKHASQHRCGNRIRTLQYVDGRETNDKEEMEGIARGYFQNLFACTGAGDSIHILSSIENGISEATNIKLLTPYRDKKAYEALKDMGPTKATGDDGFPTLFF